MKNKKEEIKRARLKAKQEKIKKDKERFKKEKKNLIAVFMFFFSLFLIFLVLVFFRVATITLTHSVNGRDLQQISQQQYTDVANLKSKRGTIYDSSNNILAVNIKQYKLTAVLNKTNTKYDKTTYTYKPYYIENPQEDAQKIIKILGYENDPYASELITSQLSQNPEEKYVVEFGVYGENISLEQKEALEAANINGLYFEEREERYYPYGDLASYVLGYAKPLEVEDDQGETIRELSGEMGIEKLLDSYLKGVDGEVEILKDKNGVPIEQEKILTPKEDGEDIYLTLDSNIQAYVHDYMLKYTEGEKFDSAVTIVMDAKTGAILGAEKFPNFNPNQRDILDYNDPFTETCFEPGSVIKTFVVAAAMKEGVWNPDDTFTSGKRVNSSWGDTNAGGANYVADWIYNEYGYGWGDITFKEGYYFSSNVAMTYLLDDIGYDNWLNYAKNVYEFGKPLETQLFTTSPCTFDPSVNFEIANTVFGQGMTTNVFQLLRAYSIFSGDGRMVNPYIIDKIVDSDSGEQIYTGKSDKPSYWEEGKNNISYDEEAEQYYKQVITPEQNKEILKLMEGVSYYNEGGNFQGTGYLYGDNTSYKIGTKTGTSQVAVDGSYQNSKIIHSVAALAPLDDPQILLYTAVFNPSATYPQNYMREYFGAIIDSSLDYLNKQNNEKISNDEKENIVQFQNYIGETRNFVETNIEEDLDYKYLGNGKVKYQYPAGNSAMSGDQEVYFIAEDAKKEDFINLNASDMENICLVMDNSCQIKGEGDSVVDIAKDGKDYIITTK